MKTQYFTLPDSFQMSYWNSIRLNLWAGVALVVAFASRSWLSSANPDGIAAVLMALAPLVPGLLYVRAIWRWMKGLDEMQRRIQLEGLCFGALGMVFLALAADLLRTAGFTPRINFGLEGYFAFTFFLGLIGVGMANRRYR